MRSRTTRRALVPLLAALLIATNACSSGSTGSTDSGATAASTAAPASTEAAATTAPSTGDTEPDTTDTVASEPPAEAESPVELRPLSTSADGRIVDDLDREVLLRGANVNVLAEYWQGDPGHDPIIPLADADWDSMAAHGFSVVRLLISWSRLEPERGVIDEAYLDEIDAHVTTAAEHGIYTVVDMHQDAYSSTIFTADPAECPPGTQPAKGWDGAPAWATITDGLSTCLLNGDRNSSPAVTAAWNHFYDDTDGIRTQFAQAWGAVAARFAGRPEVAGYNLLNEPDTSRPAAELTPLYEAMLADVAGAIRAAEAEAGAAFGHLLIVEPAIPAGNPANGIVVPDGNRMGIGNENIVAGPHNYGGSIGEGDPVSMSALFSSVADSLGIPLWIGEYGYFRRDDGTATWPRQLAADQDHKVQGGAWWQWRQGCGDPHSIGYDQPAEGEIVQLNPVQCPGDIDLGPDEDFLRVLGRAFPRAAPGRVTLLSSDPDTGVFTLEASGATADSELVVWTPNEAATHTVTFDGLTDMVELVVPGGRIITARTTGESYSMGIAPPAG